MSSTINETSTDITSNQAHSLLLPSNSTFDVSQLPAEENILPIFGKPTQANASQRKPTQANASQSKPKQAKASQSKQTQANASQRKPTQAKANKRRPATLARTLPSPSMAVVTINKNAGESSSAKTKKTKGQGADAAVSAAPTTSSPIDEDSDPRVTRQSHSLILTLKFTSSNLPFTSEVQDLQPLPSLFTLSNDSPAVATVGGAAKTRLVLDDSGANILFPETSTNLTNVRNEGVPIRGVNGVSVSSGIGKLPPMVLNTGHVLKLTEDCTISKNGDRELQAGHVITLTVSRKRGLLLE